MDAYIYKADIYCEDCMRDIKATVLADPCLAYNGDSPKGPFPNGAGEADIPQHCGSCGVFLENPLTDDGRAYVKEQIEYAIDMTGIAAGGAYPGVVQTWAKFYDITPNRSPLPH